MVAARKDTDEGLAVRVGEAESRRGHGSGLSSDAGGGGLFWCTIGGHVYCLERLVRWVQLWLGLSCSFVSLGFITVSPMFGVLFVVVMGFVVRFCRPCISSFDTG